MRDLVFVAAWFWTTLLLSIGIRRAAFPDVPIVAWHSAMGLGELGVWVLALYFWRTRAFDRSLR